MIKDEALRRRVIDLLELEGYEHEHAVGIADRTSLGAAMAARLAMLDLGSALRRSLQPLEHALRRLQR